MDSGSRCYSSYFKSRHDLFCLGTSLLDSLKLVGRNSHGCFFAVHNLHCYGNNCFQSVNALGGNRYDFSYLFTVYHLDGFGQHHLEPTYVLGYSSQHFFSSSYNMDRIGHDDYFSSHPLVSTEFAYQYSFNYLDSSSNLHRFSNDGLGNSCFSQRKPQYRLVNFGFCAKQSIDSLGCSQLDLFNSSYDLDNFNLGFVNPLHFLVDPGFGFLEPVFLLGCPQLRSFESSLELGCTRFFD